jgi:predicted RNase H-like HicB family nuclease
MLEYHAAFYKQQSGWYVVELLDFPGVFSQGKTLRSARWIIRDALKLMAESYVEDGRPLPPPNPRAKAKKADFVEPVRLSIRVHTVPNQ